jgi:hypothetical protein
MKARTLIEQFTWQLLTGFGVLAWLWHHCPCWDFPTHRQYFIMCITILPLCLISMVYTIAVAPFCFVLAALVDRIQEQ